MDKKLMNSYLETLEGFVIDEDKIVSILCGKLFSFIT